MSKYLSFYGGDRAISIIREHGLTQDIVKVVAGAAGGPKWLILSHMDRFLFSEWFPKRASGRSGLQNEPAPLFLAGSSAGAWRFAAASQKEPSKSLDKLAQVYIHQWYSVKPTLEEIDIECWKVLNGFIDENAIDEILTHPYCRLNFFSVRSKGGAVSDNPLFLTTAMVGAALSNAVNRQYLNHFFQRTLFYHPSDKPPFYRMDLLNGINGFNRVNHFPMVKILLTSENFKQALISSGSIPLVMPGVKEIPDAPDGVYRDGGTIDYHLDIPFLGLKKEHHHNDKRERLDQERGRAEYKDHQADETEYQEDKIVLFPHYTDRIVPGWLDKKLPWRKPTPENLRNVLLIAPTSRFTEMLPGGKIPERQDFTLLKRNNKERIQRWKLALKYSEILGDELCRIINSGTVGELIQPIEKISQ